MRKHLLLILFWVVLFFDTSYGQSGTSMPDLDNVGDVGQNILTKDFANGCANVTIPFYSYTSAGLSIGIDINYNTSGIKVDRVASDIGLGWELSVGGHISRQVRGIYEDEHDNLGFGAGASYQRGYWFGNETARVDSECDVFYLSFAGRSMQFVFSNTGAYLISPLNNIKIERFTGIIPIPGTMYSNYTTSTNLLSFVVTDERGNKFYFDRSKWNDQNVTSDWDLTKIVTYEGLHINYYYNSSKKYDPQFTTQTFQENTSSFGGVYVSFESAKVSYKYLDYIDFPNGLTAKFVYGSSARCDIFADASNPGNPILDEIKISESSWAYSSSAGPAKEYSYQLQHSYFMSPQAYTNFPYTGYYGNWNSTGAFLNWAALSSCTSSSDYQRYRLKLDKIISVGTNGVGKDFYTFDYCKVPLPPAVIGGRDKFGYSNGEIPRAYVPPGGYMAEYIYVPLHVLGSALVGLDQSVNTYYYQYISACNLNKITNGTGGTIDLTYRSTTALAGHDVGGVSITSIKSTDGYTGTSVIDTYLYEDFAAMIPNEGSAIIYNAKEYDYNGFTYGTTLSDWTNYLQGGNALNTGLNGTSFVFRKVTESVKDGASNFLSKTIYRYNGDVWMSCPNIVSYHADGSYSSSNPMGIGWSDFGHMPYTNKQYLKSWLTKVLLSTESYDNSSNITSRTDFYYKSIEDIAWDYGDDFKCSHAFYYPAAYRHSSSISLPNILRYPITSDMYFPEYGKLLLTKTIKKDYYKNTSYRELITNYSYDAAPHYNLVSTDFNNSKGEKITLNNYYNYKWPNSAWSSGGVAISKMNTDGLENIIYSDKWKLSGGVNKLIGLSTSAYSIVTGNIIRASYKYSLATNAATPITTSYLANLDNMSSGVAISGFFRTGAITKYDNSGYPIEESDLRGKNGDVYNSHIIDGQSGNSLVEASNAKYGEIAYCGFESDYSFSYNKGNINFSTTGISGLHKLLGRLSYHCSTAGGTTLTTSGSLISGKEYYFSIWKLSPASGGGMASLHVTDGGTAISMSYVKAYTDPYTSEIWQLWKGKFTYSGSGTGIYISGDAYIDEIKLYPADCMMKTHNFLPIIGKTADVDVNDNFITYEYGDFGNLQLIRDGNANIVRKVKTIVQGH